MKIVRRDFSENGKIFISKKLNKNFSEREKLLEKYNKIFLGRFKEIKKIYGETLSNFKHNLSYY